MKKILLIGWKDVTLAFRDRAALILMLAAPFILTLGMGFVTGRFSGGGGFSNGMSDIPVILVNQDEGQLGAELVKVFQSNELSDLLAPETMDDPDQARQAVDDDQAAAAVIIPKGFSSSMFAIDDSAVVRVALYANPTRPTSSNVIQTILETFLNQAEVGKVGAQVTITQLIQSGRLQPQEAANYGQTYGQRLADRSSAQSGSISLKNVTSEGKEVQFDILALLAPGMALMFLMYTVSHGGRSLLAERAQGTLPRLLVSPTSAVQVLAGKIVGIYLTGVAQMLILVGASAMFFQLNWGDPLAVVALVLSTVFGAVGWGLVITAVARTPGQVGAVGSAMMLLFGILGGSFINLSAMPDWFQWVSKITPNAWGLDGFNLLALGAGLPDLWPVMAPLLVMGAVLFAIAALFFNRRSIAQP